MAEISVGDVVARLKIDLTGWTQGLQAAQAQLRALQQQSQQLSGSLSTGAFTSATAAVQAFERAVQGATFAQVAATTMQNANTNAMQGGTQQTNATTASTNQLAAAYLAMAQSIQNQTQAYTQAQAAALAYRQQQDALREATRQAAAEASKAGDIFRQAFAVAGGLGIVTSLRGIAAELKTFVTESLAGFATFEAGIIKVGTLIEGFAGKGAQFDRMATQIHAWAIASGKSTADISQAMFELVSAFGGVEKASVIMVQALRLAEGGQTTAAIAGKALSTIMLGLNQDLSKTADVANAMAKAAQQNRQDLAAFASAIAPGVPVMNLARISLQNFGAAMSVLTTQGRTSSEAVSGLNQMMLNLFAPTVRADKTLRDLATAMGVPRLEAKKFQDGTFDLLSTLKQFDGLDLQVARRSLGGNTQALLTLEALIQGHDRLKERMDDANRSSQVLAQEQALNAGTVLQAWNKAAEAFKAFQDTLGQVVGQNPAVLAGLERIKQGWISLASDITVNRTELDKLMTAFAEFGTRALGILQAIGHMAIWASAQIGAMTSNISRTALEQAAQAQVTVNPRFQQGGGTQPAAPVAPPEPAPIVAPPRPAPTTTMADLTAATDAAKAAKAAAAEAEREADRDAAERRRQVFATGGEALRVIDVEVTERERLIESLRRLGAQYGMSKVARDADTASQAAAALATSGYSDEADELNKAIQASATMLEQVPGLWREAAASALVYAESQKTIAAQTDFDKKLADQLRVLQTPRDERIAVRLRTQAPGGLTTADQDRTLAQIAAQERLNTAIRLFEELGTSVGNAWTNALFSIADGTKSVASAFQQMARSILQSMAQIASQEAFKSLLVVGAGVLRAAFAPSITPNATQYGSPIGPTASGSGFLGSQGGAIVNRPTAILAGENPAMNPEFVLNRPQMQALMASAVRSAPSAGGQAAGGGQGVSVFLVDNRAQAEAGAARERAMGRQAIIQAVTDEMGRGESSQILRMARLTQR